MILLRRLNGTDIGVNADLIERVESTPDTVLTLIDGTKYIVGESAEEVVARIIEFRARILAAAEQFSDIAGGPNQSHAIPLRLVASDADDPALVDRPQPVRVNASSDRVGPDSAAPAAPAAAALAVGAPASDIRER